MSGCICAYAQINLRLRTGKIAPTRLHKFSYTQGQNSLASDFASLTGDFLRPHEERQFCAHGEHFIFLVRKIFFPSQIKNQPLIFTAFTVYTLKNACPHKVSLSYHQSQQKRFTQSTKPVCANRGVGSSSIYINILLYIFIYI